MAKANAARNLIHSLKPDVIFHLAGLTSASPGLEMVLPTMQSLLVSTVNVLTAASESGCRRLVLAASMREPSPSDGETVPSSPYAAAKFACSAYGRMFSKIYGLPVVLIRPFMTYGPKQSVSKLVPYVTLSLLRGESPKLGSGQSQADWIYIDDVIDGLLAAAVTPGVEGSSIDLGSGSLVSIRSVVERIVSLVGARIEPSFGSLPDRPMEEARVADVDGAFTLLGWKAVTPLEEGLKRTVKWYTECSNQGIS